jgi:hypothetical protein
MTAWLQRARRRGDAPCTPECVRARVAMDAQARRNAAPVRVLRKGQHDTVNERRSGTTRGDARRARGGDDSVAQRADDLADGHAPRGPRVVVGHVAAPTEPT